MSDLDLLARAMSRAGDSPDSSSSAASGELWAFVQRRVATLGLFAAAAFGLFLVWRLIAHLTSDAPGDYLPYQAGSVASLLSMWLLLRGRPRSPAYIRGVELFGLTLACGLLVAAGFFIPYVVRPDYILALALSNLLVVRSIYVPSRARTTLALGATLGVALLASVFVIHWRGFEQGIYTDVVPEILRENQGRFAVRGMLIIALWWTVSAGVAGAASHVMYGLRREARDARKLGQYTLLERIGRGGMGDVYRATHAMLRRPTAIKLLRPDRLGEDSIERFEREVQLTARLSHPNTVRVFDYGRTPDRVFYYAMELLDGADLIEVVKAGGAMSPARVIHVLAQCAGALAEAHAIGLIHRDIKPGNILLTEQGGIPDVAKVVDFGLVKEVAGARPHGETAPALTQDGTVAGTPHYMAPETITGSEVDARADLYALGAVGYYLLTGQDVFTGRTALEICSHHLQSEPDPPSVRLGKELPADLEALVMRLLEKDADDRPASARELRTLLLACADAGAWSEDDARAWWDRHHPGRAEPEALAAAATIEVDVSNRAGA